MVFLKIIFVLFVLEFIYILLFKEEKPIKFKQIIKNNGRKMYRIDYLARPKGGRLRW